MPAGATSIAKHRGLVAFAGGKLEVAEGADLPSRIVVAPWGTHDTQKGRIVIGSATAAELPGNQRTANFDRVALDFNHNTVPGSESYRGEPAKVAAHGTPGVIAGEGIVLDDVEWTPEGKEYVGGKHYIDLSPTLQLNADGEAVFLHSAAVCRQGAIPNLTLFGAEALPPQLQNRTPPAAASSKPKKMNKILAAILGVAEDADEATLESAAKAFSANIKAVVALGAFSAEELKALKTFSGSSFGDLPTQLKAVLDDVKTVKAAISANERNEIVREATLAGKAIPEAMLTGENQLPNAQLKALCATLPVTVPLERRTAALSAGAATEVTTTNTAELEVFSALGISKEQAAKYK